MDIKYIREIEKHLQKLSDIIVDKNLINIGTLPQSLSNES